MSSYLGEPQRRNSGDLFFVLLMSLAIFYLIMSFSTKKAQSDVPNESSVALPNPMLQQKQEEQNRALLQKGQDISWETERYSFIFSSQFGIPKTIRLKDYKDTSGQFMDVSAQFKDLGKLPLGYRLDGFSMDRGYAVTKGADTLTFTQSQNGLTLQKTYRFSDKDYAFTLEISLSNSTRKDILVDAYLGWGLGVGPFVPKEDRVQYDTTINRSYYDVKKEAEFLNTDTPMVGNVGWIGIDNRYFLMAIMPNQTGESLVSMPTPPKEDPYGQFVQIGNQLSIQASGTLSQSFSIYLGPKKKALLTPFGKNLELVTERGWFFFPLLGSFLIWIVTLIEGVVGSYGIAIIIFAILLRLVFHPLNIQSMVAMSKQGELQIKIKALKEKYPDKQTQNAKIMELYRTEQAGMLKGCLPLLIQIPFFITFYQQLPHLIDLTQSHFLWIKDLSSPDTVYHIEFFKNIPVFPYRLNILPIIITMATIWQMRLSMKSQTTTTQSKVMLYTMPVVFLFILWNAPSALNLYWLTQTVATMATQAYFNKHKTRILEKEKAKKKNKQAVKRRGNG